MNDSAGGHSRNGFGNRGKSIEPIDASLVACRKKIIIHNGGAVGKPNKGIGNIHVRDRSRTTDQHDVITGAAVVIDAVGTTGHSGDNSSIGEPGESPDDGINAIILNDDVDVSGQGLSRPEILKIQSRGGIDRDCPRHLRLVVINPGNGSGVSAGVIIIQFDQQCRIGGQCQVSGGCNPRAIPRRKDAVWADR